MTQIDATGAPGALVTVLRHELRQLWRERSLPLVAALLSALLLGALADGLSSVAERDARLTALATEQNTQFETLAGRLRAAEARGALDPAAAPQSLLADPGSQYAIMPTRPLAPLALGQSDLFADHLHASGVSEAQFLYESELANPWRLSAGHFDTAFVVVFLLPLLSLALSHDILSAERERGTLRLLRAQGVSATAVALGKAGAHALALALPLLALPLAGLLAFRAGAGAAELCAAYGLFAALALAYGLFWLALALLVNSFGKSSAFNALTLLCAWIALTLIAPIGLNLAVDARLPAPSRAGMIVELTEATEAAERRNAALDRTDYAALRDPAPKDGKFPIQPTTLRWLVVQKEVSEAMSPLVGAGEARAAERRDVVEAFRVLSPAAAAFEALNALAGTDSGRYLRFRLAAARFYREKMSGIFERLSSGAPATEAELRARPRFVWNEEPFADTLWRGLVGLAQISAPTALIAAYALRRLSRGA